jgi:hypothetical protein
MSHVKYSIISRKYPKLDRNSDRLEDRFFRVTLNNATSNTSGTISIYSDTGDNTGYSYYGWFSCLVCTRQPGTPAGINIYPIKSIYNLYDVYNTFVDMQGDIYVITIAANNPSSGVMNNVYAKITYD